MDRPACAAMAVLALLACGPGSKAPVAVMALLPDQTGRTLPTLVQLTTVTDVVALQGAVVSFLGGVEVRLDSADPLQAAARTDAQRYQAAVKNVGMNVDAAYLVQDGVLWPSDFHTWEMVTAYVNFERAYASFVDVYAGTDPAELRGQRVLYWADVSIDGVGPLVDNTLYLAPLKSFVVLPPQAFQRLPMSMNLGVVGHEVAHRSFNFRALADQGIAPALATWNGPAFNLLKSIDEGFADFHGYGLTCLQSAGCQPAFLAASLPDGDRRVAARDLSRPGACLDASLRTAFRTFSRDQWIAADELYQVGSLWAAALYQAGNKAGNVGALRRALVAAYDDEQVARPGLRQLISRNLNSQDQFTPEAVAEALLSHLTDPELKRLTCGELLTRLQLDCVPGGLCPLIPSCPASAARDADPVTGCALLGP
jgi:hypothetical protein